MIIRKVNDKEDVKRVICDPEIFSKISGCLNLSPDNFDFDMSVGDFLGAYVDGDIVGLSIFHEIDGDWRMHFQVLKPYRKEYADKFGDESIAWFWANHDANKLTSKIGRAHENVLKFAKRHGFKIVLSTDTDTHLELER